MSVEVLILSIIALCAFTIAIVVIGYLPLHLSLKEIAHRDLFGLVLY
jgi:hypothetical protein